MAKSTKLNKTFDLWPENKCFICDAELAPAEDNVEPESAAAGPRRNKKTSWHVTTVALSSAEGSRARRYADHVLKKKSQCTQAQLVLTGSPLQVCVCTSCYTIGDATRPSARVAPPTPSFDPDITQPPPGAELGGHGNACGTLEPTMPSTGDLVLLDDLFADSGTIWGAADKENMEPAAAAPPPAAASARGLDRTAAPDKTSGTALVYVTVRGHDGQESPQRPVRASAF